MYDRGFAAMPTLGLTSRRTTARDGVNYGMLNNSPRPGLCIWYRGGDPRVPLRGNPRLICNSSPPGMVGVKRKV